MDDFAWMFFGCAPPPRRQHRLIQADNLAVLRQQKVRRQHRQSHQITLQFKLASAEMTKMQNKVAHFFATLLRKEKKSQPAIPPRSSSIVVARYGPTKHSIVKPVVPEPEEEALQHSFYAEPTPTAPQLPLAQPEPLLPLAETEVDIAPPSLEALMGNYGLLRHQPSALDLISLMTANKDSTHDSGFFSVSGDSSDEEEISEEDLEAGRRLVQVMSSAAWMGEDAREVQRLLVAFD